MKRIRRSLALSIVCAVAATPLFAFTVPRSPGALAALAKTDPAAQPDRQVAPYDQVASALPDSGAWGSYVATLGPTAKVYFDLATGEASMVMGAPEPFIPGSGNDLTPADVSAKLGRTVTKIDTTVVTDLGNAFLDRHAALLRVPRVEIVPRRTVQVSPTMWVVTYVHAPSGIEVAGSRLTLIIGHGNLILWGSEGIFPRAAGVAPSAALSAAQAQDSLGAYVGWNPLTDRLLALPVLNYRIESADTGLLSPGVDGKHHRLAWQMDFHRDGMVGDWRAHVDATTGEVIDFADANEYAHVDGGIEPNNWTETEEERPLGEVAMTSCGAGGSCFTSIEGNFDTAAGSTTGSLVGRLTTISDRCGSSGAPTVNSDGLGDVHFDVGPPNPLGDADCTTNGVGNSAGAHNTHASRSAYYHITRLKDKSHSWLPTNSWLDSSHQVRVNINNVCNAYWSPSGYNGFFQEGFSGGLHCYNTGEIAAVFLHEVGHGLDQNDAQGTGSGSGEGYADTIAMLQLHVSCMGDTFWNQECPGYGVPCVACTGVRDQDYAQHTSGGNPVTTPFTPANFIAVHCGSGGGNCGKEVHCESYVTAGTIWDLANRKLTSGHDADSSWFITERDFMVGTNTFTAAYSCSGGGTTSSGCAATSWFMGMLTADDDNGNLTDGTPHAASLFAAFNDHAIACGSVGDASNQNNAPTCSALAAPSISVVAAPPAPVGNIRVTWSPVAGAGGYAILKNHGECSNSYQQAANVGSGATTFDDADVVAGQLYGYRVVALGSSGAPTANACYSDLSNCGTATLGGGGDVIFSDGFESGDTSAWSATIP